MNVIEKRPKNSLLSFKERVVIEIRWREGKRVSNIALEINRDKSVISREIGGKPRKGMGAYSAEIADKKAKERIGNRGNKSKMDKNENLEKYVETKLRLGWSPEQIDIRLPIDFPDDKEMRISYEAIYGQIYRNVYRNGNGYVKPNKKDLRSFLPRRHKRRVKKGMRKARKMERNSVLPSIEIRPKVVLKRSRVGHWEDDTLVSRECSAKVKSVNERKTGVFFFAKTKDGTAKECDAVLKKRLSAIPSKFRKTLTRDRGSENLRWREVEKELGVSCYFAHAYCSGERGSNENGNGLLRRFFPKRTNWDMISDEDISKAEYLINSRPRKRLGGLTPYEAFYKETGVALIS